MTRQYLARLRRARSSLGLAGVALEDGWRSRMASGFWAWCVHRAWRECRACGRRDWDTLTEASLARGMAGDTSMEGGLCSYCSRGVGYKSPRREAIPGLLRGLEKEVVQCLRPLHLYYPYEKRACGYRVHVTATRLCWCDDLFAARVARLAAPLQAKARRVHDMLLGMGGSAYRDFEREHVAFHTRRAAAGGSAWLPVNALLRAGIECALWPHLFVETAWCMSVARGSAKRKRPAREEESSEEEDAAGARGSCKDAFMALAMSEVPGFASEYDLLHFAYDQWLFATLTGAAAIAGDNLRNVLGNKQFSPAYWRWQHLKLVDGVRQLGQPSVFLTLAPYEWTFPMANWVERVRAELGRKVTDLSGPETLHITHVLFQAVAGLLAGRTSGKAWQHHLLSDKSSGAGNVRAFFCRAEFQDGSRKQSYHGRGTVHVHALFWMRSLEAASLHTLVSADLPSHNPELAALAQMHQRSSQVHDLPRAKCSAASPSTMTLRRTRGAMRLNLRAYFVDLLAALRCHSDVIWGLGRGLLLRYVAGYVPKDSDSFRASWLEGRPNGWSLAMRVLCGYHPMEPQMWLAMSRLPLVRHSGMGRQVAVPDPGQESVSALWLAYMRCRERPRRMSMYDWLHKYRVAEGDSRLYMWVQRRWAQVREPKPNFTEWLCGLRCEGEVLVACSMFSRQDDRWFGQWLVLNYPHTSKRRLRHELQDRVPRQIFWFAAAWALAPEYWRDRVRVRSDMEVEGHKDEYIENFMSHVFTMTEMITAGTTVAAGVASSSVAEEGQIPELTRRQDLLVQESLGHVKRLLRGGGLDGGVEAPCLAWLGGAGTGKSVAAHGFLRASLGRQAVVRISCPTGRQVARYRRLFPQCEVDTVHAATDYNGTRQKDFATTGCDVWLVEEIGQVPVPLFEHLIGQWLQDPQRPVLLLIGDFGQLQPVDIGEGGEPQVGQPCCVSPLWAKLVGVRKLTRTLRSCDPDLTKWLEVFRHRSPTRVELRRLCRARKVLGNAPPDRVLFSKLFQRLPETTVVTWSVARAEEVNGWITDALFAGAPVLGHIMFAPANEKCAPCGGLVYAGLRVILTMNLAKRVGFVNGMGARVVEMVGTGARVHTEEGRELWVYPLTDKLQRWYYPMRVGYAVNLSKIQGETVRHLTLWLDVAGVAAAFYTALSRVRRLEDFAVVGQLERRHCVPSVWV